jgi:hypothetical protein
MCSINDGKNALFFLAKRSVVQESPGYKGDSCPPAGGQEKHTLFEVHLLLNIERIVFIN